MQGTSWQSMRARDTSYSWVNLLCFFCEIQCDDTLDQPLNSNHNRRISAKSEGDMIARRFSCRGFPVHLFQLLTLEDKFRPNRASVNRHWMQFLTCFCLLRFMFLLICPWWGTIFFYNKLFTGLFSMLRKLRSLKKLSSTLLLLDHLTWAICLVYFL